jgi:ribosomal protein L11 methyltransferase
VRVPRSEAEIARAHLIELAPGGFEEVERTDGVEFVVYTNEGRRAAIEVEFPNAVSIAVEPASEREWEERWRAFHRPVQAGGLWIGPPWEAVPAGAASVVIDPGRAFGTGAHATTRACIELLAAQERGSVLEAGCGSGVIAVAACRLGFRPVLAADTDPVAVETARVNAMRNDVVVEVCALDVLRDELPVADLVVANIELASVEALLARLRAPLAITSGYLVGEAPAVPGWRLRETLELDGWAAHILEFV